MKKIISPRWAATLAYGIVPFVVGFSCIVKVFLLEDCYVFETNDEVSHTFLEIPRAWKILGEGMLPLMNFFNNFGTPLIGDPVVNPFALHTIPYLLLSAPAASTLNRFLAISLTISILTLFYRRYFSRSLLAASVSAIWVVMLPAFEHFSVHHPHQFVVLYFTAILIMQQEMTNRPGLKTLAGLYVTLLLFSLGVGLNPFFFAWPFLLLNQFLLSRCKIDRNCLLFALLALSVFVLLYPQLYSFIQYSSLTARAALDYAQLLPFTVKRLLMDIFFFRTQDVLIHVSDAVYYSLPALFLAAVGLWSINSRGDRLRITILGVIPFFGVMVLLAFGEIRSSWLPFLKPVDITRFLWFANIFIAVLLGYALDRIRQGALHDSIKVLLLLMLPLSLTKVFQVAVVTGLILAGVLFMTRAALRRINRSKSLDLELALAAFFDRRNPTAFLLAAVGSLFFSFLPVHNHYSGLETSLRSCNGFRYAKASFADFQPQSYLEIIRPFERFATQFEPITHAFFMQATKHDIFSSDGRSIILHSGLKKYLRDHALIREGWNGMTYYFSSIHADSLSQLGIKYVIARKPQANRVRSNGLLAAQEGQVVRTSGGVRYLTYLYETGQDVSVGYLTSGRDRQALHDLEFRGNRISVALPALKKEVDLVLTFVNWPGWTVRIDGKPRDLLGSDAHFLRAVVKPGDRSVVFEFQPFTVLQIISYAAGSFLLFALTLVLFAVLRRCPVTSPQCGQDRSAS